VEEEVDTVFTAAGPLWVTHDSMALQLTAPSAKEKRGKVAAIVVRILECGKMRRGLMRLEVESLGMETVFLNIHDTRAVQRQTPIEPSAVRLHMRDRPVSGIFE
jgi:hypothetical protein